MKLLKNYLSPQAYQAIQAEKARRLVSSVLYSHDVQPPDPIEWIEENFYLYDTGNLMSFFDCQLYALREALRRDTNGNFIYDTVLWSWPKKSAKSSVVASVADYIAEHTPNGSVKLVANDLKQADSRVGYYLREAIKIGQRKGKRGGIVINPSGYKITYPNNARVESVSIDPSGEAGGNDDMVVFSELWGWKSKAHQRMWSEMTISPNRFGRSQRWIDTYAGISGESPILEQLYETGVKNGTRIPNQPYEFYVNPAARMLTVWVTQHHFPWQTPEYYAQEAGQLLPSEYRRMHDNQWADSTEVFIPSEWWDACKVSALTDLGRRGVIIALDAAVENDCFALVMVSTTRGKVEVRHVQIWTPQDGEQINFDQVEDELKRLIKEYNVIEVAYDPYQLASMSQRLGGLAYWREFSQGAPRLTADKMLYDTIRDRNIQHTGQAQLAEHIQNADRKPTENNTCRIVKRVATKKIDACVALSMANDRALYYNL
jgi:hypothetical protein